MSRGNKDGYIGMSAGERRLIEVIRKSKDPGRAMEKAAEVITAFLVQPQSSEEPNPVDLSVPCETIQ